MQGFLSFDSNYKIIGHLAVMDDKPMLDKKRTLSILKIFAAWAGAELERKRTESAMRNMAYHDALTDLPNRILLNDRLEMALLQARRNDSLVALLYIDFDHFKQINDRYGHQAGDAMLIHAASAIKSNICEFELAARMGGDEFVVLLDGAHHRSDIQRVTGEICEAVALCIPWGNSQIKVSASLGVAWYPEDGEDLDDLILKADTAMFQSKASIAAQA